MGSTLYIYIYINIYIYVQEKPFNLVTDSLANPIAQFFALARDNLAPPDVLVFSPRWRMGELHRKKGCLPATPTQRLGLGRYR